MKKSTPQRGVAILFAILLVSIVLTVGLTLLNITVRQLVLSSLARESQFAFYAADSARNCARYYDSLANKDDRSFGYFYLNSGNLDYQRGSGALTPNCGSAVSDFTSNITSDPKTFTFVITFDNTSGSTNKPTCAQVIVTKDKTGTSLGVGKTKIEASGYNNYKGPTGGTCYLPSDRTVERTLTMIY